MENKTDIFGGSKNLRIGFCIVQWALIASLVPSLVRIVSWFADGAGITDVLFWLAPSTIVVVLLTAALIFIRYGSDRKLVYGFLIAAAVVLLTVAVRNITDNKYDLAAVRSNVFGVITESSVIISVFLVTKRNTAPLFWVFWVIGYVPHLIYLLAHLPRSFTWFLHIGDELCYILLAVCTAMLFVIKNARGICPKCGFKNIKKARFCSGCGEKM